MDQKLIYALPASIAQSGPWKTEQQMVVLAGIRVSLCIRLIAPSRGDRMVRRIHPLLAYIYTPIFIRGGDRDPGVMASLYKNEGR